MHGERIARQCALNSGDGGLGTVRSIGHEVLVGKTKYSYTYTQPVREGVSYNMYHGSLEAVPLTDKVTRLNYTLVFDNSNLADDTARSKDIDNRRTRFSKMLETMKALSEGKHCRLEAFDKQASHKWSQLNAKASGATFGLVV